MPSPRAIRLWSLVHTWTSLVCTIFLLLLCLTGLPLIFSHEIDHLSADHVEPPPMAQDAPRVSVDRIIEAARASRPSETVLYVFPDDEEPLWGVTMGPTPDVEDPSAYLVFDARTGALLQDHPLGGGFMDLMFRLHVDLFAGLPGMLFLGVMGLLFVAAIVSGVVLYAPFMRKLGFGVVRTTRTSRLRWLDLHNLIGIVTLAWAFVVGLTGVINTLSVPLAASWQAEMQADLLAAGHRQSPPARFGSLQAAILAAQGAAPGMELSFVAYPGTAYSDRRHYGIFMEGATPLTSKLYTPVLVNAETSVLTGRLDRPWYMSALFLSQPLHFGDYGGLPLKILWALLDIATIVVLGSGLYLWLVRKGFTRRGATAALPSGQTAA